MSSTSLDAVRRWHASPSPYLPLPAPEGALCRCGGHVHTGQFVYCGREGSHNNQYHRDFKQLQNMNSSQGVKTNVGKNRCKRRKKTSNDTEETGDKTKPVVVADFENHTGYDDSNYGRFGRRLYSDNDFQMSEQDYNARLEKLAQGYI